MTTSLRELAAKWRAEADTFMAYTTAPAGLTWDHGAADAKREDARQLEAALSTPPAGMVLVPKEPTMEMVVAGFEAAYDCEEAQDDDTQGTCKGAAEVARATYAAMIAATEGE